MNKIKITAKNIIELVTDTKLDIEIISKDYTNLGFYSREQIGTIHNMFLKSEVIGLNVQYFKGKRLLVIKIDLESV